MAWGPLLFGAGLLLQGIQSYSAGQSQRRAAQASNKEQKKLNEAQFERDSEVWEMDYLNSLIGHAYKLAENAALQYKDDVAKADYEKQQSAVVEAALQNLELNKQALVDQYRTAESLRYDDELRQLEYNIGNLGYNRQNAQLDQALQAARLQQQYLANTNSSTATKAEAILRARETTKLNKNEAIQRAKETFGLQKRETIQTARETEKARTTEAVDRARGTNKLERNINRTVYGDRVNAVKNNRDVQLRTADLRETIRNNELDQAFRTNITNNNIEAAQSNRQALDAVSQYMNRIESNKIQADQLLAQKQNQGADIQEQIILGEAVDTMARDAEYVAAMGESATRRAIATARSGGSKSAAKASLDAMQAMGRTYGLMRARQDQRRQAMNNYNASVIGETAEQFAQLAKQSEGIADQVENTKSLQSLRNQGYKANDASLRAGFALDKLAVGKQTLFNKYAIRQDSADQIRGLLNQKNASDAQNKLRKKYTIRSTELFNKLELAQTERSARLQEKIGVGQTERNAKLTNNLQYLQTARSARLTDKLNQANNKATYDMNLYGIRKAGKLNKEQYKYDLNNQLNTFNNSTVPGFGLAKRQGERELKALYQNTFNQINQAATPYREAIIIDPPEPIAGLKPELRDSGKTYVPSTGSILLNTFTSVAGQALASARTGADGSTKFW